MSSWLKALIIAGALEAPQVFGALHNGAVRGGNILVNVVAWYHIPALWFANWVLLMWNPISRPPLPSSNLIAWISVFAFQVLITAPIIYVIFWWTASPKREREG